MAGAPSTRPRRLPPKGRRSRRRRLTIAGTAGLAVAVVVIGATGRTADTPPTVRASRTPTQATQQKAKLHPPGPIPGYLLIADRGNNRMLLVDSAHRLYWRYPGGGARAMPFVFDDDTFFGPDRRVIISNQEDQDTIQIISFPGKHVLWRYGHVNVKSGAPGYLNTPDDAYLLPNRLVSVADAYNCRVLFISPAHRVVRQYGTTGACRHDPPRYLGAVNGATPLPDGGTLVSEIAGSWIDDIGPTGRLRWAVQAPVAYPSDPQLLAPNRILLADYSKPGGAIIMTRTGRILWRYGPASGPGELDHPSLATRIAGGLIAINDDFRDRVVIVSLRSRSIIWQYGHTDRPGRGAGYLNTPDGLDLLPTRAAQTTPGLYRVLARAVAAHRATLQTPPKNRASLRTALAFRLRSPIEREVTVADDGRIVIAGGLDSGGGSASGVFRLDPDTGTLTSIGSVPQAFHDASGAIIGRALYIFGGGSAQSSSAVQRFSLATHASQVVARLPRALSDIASATTPDGVFLVGGFDGHIPRAEIYRTADGSHFAVAARLPVGLRYPAVAALGSRVVIAGGVSAQGPTDRVYELDTATGRLRTIGRLPEPVAHAEAFRLGSRVYVAGGVDRSGNVTGRVFEIDPATGRIDRVAGTLPVRDAATVDLRGSALVIGGTTAAGTTADVLRIALR